MTTPVTAPDGPRWVSVAFAARAINEHRQQLQRMIRNGTFPRRYVDLTGTHPRILLADGLERAVKGCKRFRYDGN